MQAFSVRVDLSNETKWFDSLGGDFVRLFEFGNGLETRVQRKSISAKRTGSSRHGKGKLPHEFEALLSQTKLYKRYRRVLDILLVRESVQPL